MFTRRSLFTNLLAGILLLCVMTVPQSSLAEPDEKANAEQPTETLVVTVADAEGEPIAGVRVCPRALRSIQGHGQWRIDGIGDSEPQPATTNAKGEATITYPVYADFEERIETTYVTVSIEHPDFVSLSLNEIPVTEEAKQEEEGSGSALTMKPGAQVTLVADTDVELQEGELHALWSSEMWGSEEASKAVDASTILLPRVPAGEQLVRLVRCVDGVATHFSSVEALKPEANQESTHKLRLEAAIDVHGVLSENVPRPIKNGRVAAWVIKSISDGGHVLRWMAWAPVDDDGNFTLKGMPPEGNLQLICLCDGWIAESGPPPEGADDRAWKTFKQGHFGTPQSFALQTISDAPEKRLTLAMTQRVRCTFEVVDPDGEAVADAKIYTSPNVLWYGAGSQIYCDTLLNSSERLQERQKSYRELVNLDYPKPFRTITGKSGTATMDLPANLKRDYVIDHPTMELPIIGGEREGSFQVPAEGSISIKVVLQPKSGDVLGNWDKASEVLSSCTSAACLALRKDKRFAELQDKSRDLFDELESNPDPSLKSMAYHALAEALEQLGEPEQAKRSLLVAIEAAPAEKQAELKQQLDELQKE